MPMALIVIILGIVEGITEFIPVSSTGHLLLAEHLLRIKISDLFNVVIQCGAVLAVIPLFSGRILQLTKAPTDPAMRLYLSKIALAFFITAVGGFVMDKMNYKLEDKPFPVAVALIAGGILFILVEYFISKKSKVTDISWTVVLAVGIGQLIAAGFPGASRSGTTILLALIFGLARPQATEFSFLVGIPTMLAAGGYKILKALKHADVPHESWSMILLSTLVAAVVSFFVVKWMLRYVQTHTFTSFGIYRIAAGICVLILMR
ncbi:MAG: pyrophosphate phosphatase [Verrucomicrobiales bacterium]|jgi:undecaprenyl-diphosphatase|nr:pyrophosphate phosphatase [Verrucomicrobiales bacterium]